jgi:hypothetical protein
MARTSSTHARRNQTPRRLSRLKTEQGTSLCIRPPVSVCRRRGRHCRSGEASRCTVHGYRREAAGEGGGGAQRGPPLPRLRVPVPKPPPQRQAPPLPPQALRQGGAGCGGGGGSRCGGTDGRPGRAQCRRAGAARYVRCFMLGFVCIFFPVRWF